MLKNNEPKFDLTPLSRIDLAVAPCKGLVPFLVLFTIRHNLLALVYELRREAVQEFTHTIQRKVQ